mmetsp:Transcript_5194/g.13021  ORF Transcript_5194/g.13021 Transcript_5194/m.13021 type:complete len:225 (+) Transcript_5194:1982-2656(+)
MHRLTETNNHQEESRSDINAEDDDDDDELERLSRQASAPRPVDEHEDLRAAFHPLTDGLQTVFVGKFEYRPSLGQEQVAQQYLGHTSRDQLLPFTPLPVVLERVKEDSTNLVIVAFGVLWSTHSRYTLENLSHLSKTTQQTIRVHLVDSETAQEHLSEHAVPLGVSCVRLFYGGQPLLLLRKSVVAKELCSDVFVGPLNPIQVTQLVRSAFLAVNNASTVQLDF